MVSLSLQTTLGRLDDVLQPPTEPETGQQSDLLPDDPPLPGQAGGETPGPPELHHPGPGQVVLSPLLALQPAVLAVAEEPVAPGQVVSPLPASDGPLLLQEVVVTQRELLPGTDGVQGDDLQPPGGVRGVGPDSVVAVTAAGVVQSGGGEEDSTGGEARHHAVSQLETVGTQDTWPARYSSQQSASQIYC